MNVGLDESQHQPVQVVKEAEQEEGHLTKRLHFFPCQSREDLRRVISVFLGVEEEAVVGQERQIPCHGGKVAGEQQKQSQQGMDSHLRDHKLDCE